MYIEIGDFDINLETIGGINYRDAESGEGTWEIVVFFPASTWTVFEGSRTECEAVRERVRQARENQEQRS